MVEELAERVHAAAEAFAAAKEAAEKDPRGVEIRHEVFPGLKPASILLALCGG
jgi:hypothetical protein